MPIFGKQFATILVSAVIATMLTACGEKPAALSETSTATETTQAKLQADTVYTNRRIYTVNANQPWAEAVAIKAGKFVAVG